MSATHDKTTQIVKVGALVALDKEVLENGIGFISERYPPLLMKFEFDENGDVSGYDIQPIKPETPDIQKVNFVKVLPPKPSPIIGVRGKNLKLIIPGE